MHGYFLAVFTWIAGLAPLLDSLPSVRVEPKLRLVAQFPFRKPAFITTVENPLRKQNSSSVDLLISSFGVSFLPSANPDGVHFIPNIAEAFRTQSFVAQPIGSHVVWPNQVQSLDEDRLVVAGGFLVPGKHGHVSMLDYRAFRRHEASELVEWTTMVQDGSGFYHRVKRVNVFNRAAAQGDDGYRWVTCRGEKSVFGQSQGQMIFIEPPSATSGDNSENETRERSSVVGSGPRGVNGFNVYSILKEWCDCYFETVDLNRDGIPEFLIPSFFGKKFILAWTEHPLGDYSQPSFIRYRVLDDNVGAAFDVQSVDLDGDGQDEILVTNHQSGRGPIRPSVFAYHYTLPSFSHDSSSQSQHEEENRQQRPFVSFPSLHHNNVSDFMMAIAFERKTLFDGFQVVNHMFMAAGPGSAQAVRTHRDSKEAPVLVVSGDGTEKAHLITSDNENVEGGYKHSIFHDCHGTVGGIAVADVDGDGWQDVFVPCYDKDYIAVYTFAP